MSNDSRTTRVLVLYYSSYGHIETMAGAVAEGARQAGAEVEVMSPRPEVPGEPSFPPAWQPRMQYQGSNGGSPRQGLPRI
jgi:hypothetical protein